MGFVHLHVHSHYSLLDSTVKIPKLVDLASGMGMESVAVTDHGNLFGAIEIFKTSKKSGIKRLIGSEVLLGAVDPQHANENRLYSLVLIAKTNAGYQSLLRLVSDAWRERFQRKDRRAVVNFERLERGTEGVIALSGGLSGEIPQALLRGDKSRAKRAVERLRGWFGSDLYLEIHLQFWRSTRQCAPC